MEFKDFSIGLIFALGDYNWVCTDIGTRTIVAIKITDKVYKDRSWLDGPPYAAAEFVLDENDLKACS